MVVAINLCKFSLRAGIKEGKWVRLQLKLRCWGWVLGVLPRYKALCRSVGLFMQGL